MTPAADCRLLVVDDEPQLVRALIPALQASGYDVVVATDGAQALAAIGADRYRAIILDLGLPDIDGKHVLAQIREWSDVPIIVLSARDLESERIAALDLGADDFINKPFTVGELLARIRAAMRSRERRSAEFPAFKAEQLSIDLATRQVIVAGNHVRLTPREHALLRILVRNAGMVMTHRQIVAAVWSEDALADAQSVRVLVGQLRQKIEPQPGVPRYLLTESGVGYRLVGDDDA